jgi:4-hydroxybenzoate polyprenyltransferase
MTVPSLLHRQVHFARHFIATRSLEILALQSSPLLGLVYGGARPETVGYSRLGSLVVGSLFLTTHIFVFNDWSGYISDSRDPNRTAHAFGRANVSKFQLACAATMLLVLANVSLAFAGIQAVLVGASITLLSLLYSGSARFGKNRPFAASANHLVGGSLHFLLGYTLCHAPDGAGMVLSLFFGLVFAGGHLNQEIRDCDGDRLNGIRTCAVAYGCRRALAGSVLLFAMAYVVASALAALGILPAILVWCPVLVLVHLAAAQHALRYGLGYETAVWMQRRYRALFALIGFIMFFWGIGPKA